MSEEYELPIGEQLAKYLERMQKRHIVEGTPLQDLERLGAESRASLIDELVEAHLESTLAGAKTERELSQQETAGFLEDLENQWGEAIALLEVLVRRADQLMMDVHGKYRSQPHSPREPKAEALINIGARASKITLGAAHSLRGGFPDAALRSWRTLHELGTIALLLARADDEIAERYMAARHVKRAKEAEAYANTEGLPSPPSEGALKILAAEKARVVRQYGKVMLDDYGWAAPAFPEIVKRPPNIRDLEETVGTHSARWRHRVATREVHAGFLNPREDLGLTGVREMRLLAGPSNVGQHLPGSMIAEGLYLVSLAVFEAFPSLDRKAHIAMMKRLVDVTQGKFFEARGERGERA